MNQKQIKEAAKVLATIISKYKSLREFSKIIDEHSPDVSNWRDGIRKISPKAVVSICRLHPEIAPSDLNSYCFPTDIEFNFNKKGSKNEEK